MLESAHIQGGGVGMEAEGGIADSLHLVKLGVADGSGFYADLFI